MTALRCYASYIQTPIPPGHRDTQTETRKRTARHNERQPCESRRDQTCSRAICSSMSFEFRCAAATRASTRASRASLPASVCVCVLAHTRACVYVWRGVGAYSGSNGSNGSNEQVTQPSSEQETQPWQLSRSVLSTCINIMLTVLSTCINLRTPC